MTEITIITALGLLLLIMVLVMRALSAAPFSTKVKTPLVEGFFAFIRKVKK